MSIKLNKNDITIMTEIVKKIKKYKNIVLTSHVNPDADSLGSVLAFYNIIQEYNKNIIDENEKKFVKIYIDDKLPNYIKSFEDVDKIEIFSDSVLNEYKDGIDLFISLDCANDERYGNTIKLKSLAKESINIDHHVSNTMYADINYVRKSSSTCEIVYDFLKLFDVKLSKKIGEYIYFGIIGDTGNFVHDNVTKNTFEIAGNIMNVGVDNNKIANILFEITERKVKLLGDVYCNSIYDKENKFIYYYMTKEFINKYNIEKEDTEGIVEMLLKISNVEISLFLKENDDNSIKGSLRAKNKYDVNSIASIFGGGGHIKAAGFKTNLSINEILSKIYEIL